MNKIVLDNELYVLENNISDIEINGDCTIYVINLVSENNINIVLNDGASLRINDFNLNDKSINYNVEQTNDTSFIYNHSFKISGLYSLNMIVNINGNNNVNKVNIYGISNGDAKLIVDGIVKSGTVNNVLDENIKVLTIGGKCFTRPMMHINVKECIANHNTAISNVREDQVFYLMSKGIDRNTAVSIISDGYLYGLFKSDEEFLNRIK